MNPDVCKKCGKIYCRVYKRKNKDLIEFCCMKCFPFISFIKQSEMKLFHVENNEWIEYNDFLIRPNIEIDKKQIDEALINLGLNKNCPYYIEHQINDWNKNES